LNHVGMPLDAISVNALKERGCYVAPGAAASSDASYALPDGRTISAPPACLATAPLALFEPHRVSCAAPGLADVLASLVVDAAPPHRRQVRVFTYISFWCVCQLKRRRRRRDRSC
jgi:hypothetical protein